MASYIRLYGIVARGDYIIDSLDLLRGLIPLKCINDPSFDLKPDAICVKGVEEGMRRSEMDPRSFESGGLLHIFRCIWLRQAYDPPPSPNPSTLE
jgi:hypothetical protein